MKSTIQYLGTSLIALFVAGCAEAEPGPEEQATGNVTAALDTSTVVGTMYDDSAAPVHVQIRSCKSATPAITHQVDCRVDPEYALVGGGATASATSGGLQVLTENRPVDGRTWRGSSADLWWAQHDLTVHAIGLRLDGVNTQTLRDSIGWKTQITAGTTVSVSAGNASQLGGGARTQPNAGVYGYRPLVTDGPPTSAAWKVVASDQFGAVPGTTEVTLLQIDNQTIEGFGVLEVMHKSGPARSTSGGYHSTTLSVDQGWAMIGMGASAQTTTGGPLRIITSIAPCTTGRCATVTTGDQTGGSSAGTTIPYLSQIRKQPGSHGLCNPGSALLAGFDSCVARICATRRGCCASSWDSTCVQMVTSACGRSCAAHTCTPTVFEPSRWVGADGSAVASNCYYYALNKYPDGLGMDPGTTLNLRPDDEFSMPRLPALAAGDGLIPTTFGGQCTDNRTKVFLEANTSGYFGYHWFRQDVGGNWSDKFGTFGYPELTPDTGVHPYHDVQRNQIGAFFCACDHPLPNP
jgi:hypothetical protein